MCRPPWHRALSALLALWLVVVLAEPTALHVCAMHSAGHAGAAGASAEDGAPSRQHGDHGTSRAADDHAPAPTNAHVCTCLGDCSGSVVARAPAAHTALTTLTRLTAVTPGRPQHEYVAAWVDFVLPFATAPPAPAVA